MGIIASKSKNGEYLMLLWGTASRDAKLEFTQAKGLPKVTFGIKYERGNFMNVLVLGDTQATRLAACVEKGDTVFCTGIWSKKEYTTKKGEKKEWSELKVEFISVQTAAPDGDEREMPMDDGEPDAFESANDEYEESYDYEPTI